MAHLNINLEETPSEILPLPSGIYNLRIDEAPTIEEARSGKGVNVIVRHKVDGGEYDGRTITNFIFQSDLGKVALKRLVLSSGLPITTDGLDMEDFVGTICRAQVTQGAYKDSDGVDRVSNNIKDYLLPE